VRPAAELLRWEICDVVSFHPSHWHNLKSKSSTAVVSISGDRKPGTVRLGK
jgi:hypothetical protein